MPYLDGSMHLGLGVAHVDEPSDGDSQESRLHKRRVVQQNVNVTGRQHDERENALKHATSRRHWTTL